MTAGAQARFRVCTHEVSSADLFADENVFRVRQLIADRDRLEKELSGPEKHDPLALARQEMAPLVREESARAQALGCRIVAVPVISC